MSILNGVHHKRPEPLSFWVGILKLWLALKGLSTGSTIGIAGILGLMRLSNYLLPAETLDSHLKRHSEVLSLGKKKLDQSLRIDDVPPRSRS